MFTYHLHEGEQVVGMYRQSGVVLTKTVLLLIVLLAVPLWYLDSHDLLFDYRLYFFIWTVLVVIYGTHKYLLWLLNAYLLTSMRIISIHYSSLFSKKIMEAPATGLTNIGYQKTGPWQALFDYGNIEMHMPMQPDPIILRNISNPEGIKNYIWKMYKPGQNSSATSEILKNSVE